MKRTLAVALAVTAAMVLAVTAALAAKPKNDGMTGMAGMSGMAMPAKQTLSASDLRATLGQLFGEHAALAMNATDQGLTGAPSFAATAKALDRNSVAISKAIGSVYGAKAGATFLNGKYMWRDHIKFFVDYTVATAKHDKAGQTKAVANLKLYTVKFGDFLAGATGLPKTAVRNDLLAHVLQLKGQLDLYAVHNYAGAATQYSQAYDHMFMTADLVAGAIAKQKGLK